MMMDIMAIGCILAVGDVMIAMWQFDIRNSRDSRRDNTGSSKERKGGKTR